MQNDNSKFKTEFKKRLYKCTLQLVEFIDSLGSDNVSKRIGDQLLRSGTSIIGNYVEGQAASSRKDFTNYLNTALKSTNESKLWLALLRDSGHADANNVKPLLSELDELSRMIASSILTLRGKK